METCKVKTLYENELGTKISFDLQNLFIFLFLLSIWK